MSDDLWGSLVRAFRQRLGGTKAVVFCSHHADTLEWASRLLLGAGCTDVLALAFDTPDLACLLPPTPSRSASQLVADRRALVATLDDDSPLGRLVDDVDPDRRAVVLVTDPVDSPRPRAADRSGASTRAGPCSSTSPLSTRCGTPSVWRGRSR